MLITIDNKTKTCDVVYLLHTQNIETVLKQVPPLPLDKDIVDMTIKEFDDMLSQPLVYIQKMMDDNEMALDFLGKYKTYKSSVEGFFSFHKQFETKQTAEEKQAANGINFPSFSDRMLATLIKYYNLNSIESAANMKVREYLFAFHDQASTSLYQERLQEIVTKKNKNKKK